MPVTPTLRQQVPIRVLSPSQLFTICVADPQHRLESDLSKGAMAMVALEYPISILLGLTIEGTGEHDLLAKSGLVAAYPAT